MQPPCPDPKCDQQVEPTPRLLDNPGAGCHRQIEEAGDGAELLQAPAAQVPAKTPERAAAISPHHQAEGRKQDARPYDAQAGEVGRKAMYIKGMSAHNACSLLLCLVVYGLRNMPCKIIACW